MRAASVAISHERDETLVYAESNKMITRLINIKWFKSHNILLVPTVNELKVKHLMKEAMVWCYKARRKIIERRRCRYWLEK